MRVGIPILNKRSKLKSNAVILCVHVAMVAFVGAK